MWTKWSLPPVSGVMKPKPLVVLKNLTVPLIRAMRFSLKLEPKRNERFPSATCRRGANVRKCIREPMADQYGVGSRLRLKTYALLSQAIVALARHYRIGGRQFYIRGHRQMTNGARTLVPRVRAHLGSVPPGPKRRQQIV